MAGDRTGGTVRPVRGSRRFRAGRFILRALASLAALTCAIVVYLSFYGLPSRWTAAIAEALGSEDACVEIGHSALALPDGLSFRDVKYYRRGMIGPAVFEAGHLVVRFRKPGSESPHRLEWIRGVEIGNGVFRDMPAGGKNGDTGASRQGGDADIPAGRWRVSLADFELYGLEMARADCEIVAGIDGSFAVENAHGWVGKGGGEGPFEMKFRQKPGTGGYEGMFKSDFTPALAAELFRTVKWPGLRRFVTRFVFAGKPPTLTAVFNGGGGNGYHGEGTFEGSDFTFNGVQVDHAFAPVFIISTPAESSVRLDPLRIKRAEGEIETTFTVDHRSDIVTFRGTSTAHPEALAELISRGGSAEIEGFRFNGPVRVETAGHTCMTNERVCELWGNVTASLMEYGRHKADACTFRIERSGLATTVTNLTASMYGGTVTGCGRVEPLDGGTGSSYRTSMTMKGLSFKEVVVGLTEEGAENEYSGKLDCSIELSGVTGSGRQKSMNGKGSFKIINGRIMRLPLFGGLSDRLAGSVPGVDYVLKQTDARGAFRIDSGVASSEDLRIEGDVLSLRSDGWYDLASRRMDFNVELRFLKDKTIVGDVVQTIFLPVSKLFKVRLQGTMEEPTWSSFNF